MVLVARSSRASYGLTLVLALCSVSAGCGYDFDAHFGGAGEDCTNGLDDDGDGKIDCEDPDCGGAAFACVEPAPDGWSGPALLTQVMASGELVCPAPWKSDVEAPTCTPCSCMGGSCSLPTTRFVDQCSGGGDPQTPSDTDCHSIEVSGGDNSAIGDVTAPTGSCQAATSTQTSALLCLSTYGAGCSGGQACAPAGDGPLCVFQKGSVACPPGPYARSRAVLAPGATQPTCSTCTCGNATGTCTGETHVFEGSSCGSGGVIVENDGTTCAMLGFSPQSMQYVPGPSDVSCAPAGGEPMAADTGSEITVCCEAPL